MNYAKKNLDFFDYSLHPSDNFEKGNLIKTRCRVCLTYAVCMDDIETWGKRLLLAWSKNAGRWYKLSQIIENLSSHTSRFICDLSGMREVERS